MIESFITGSCQEERSTTCRIVQNVSKAFSTATAMQLGLQSCKICYPANNIYAINAPVVNNVRSKGRQMTLIGWICTF